MAFLLLLCFSLAISVSSGADTITANQSIAGDQTIISKDENFELGFFKPGNSSKYYIGIWYKKVTTIPPTVAWVANRATPVSDRFNSELKIVDGNLVLFNESKSPIWSTEVNTSNSESVMVAVLLHDGNLVLRNELNEHVWQSFDSPAHTWLPGARLAYNNITRRSQLLTSWKTSEDPAEGLFSLELDPDEKRYVIKWNRTEQYWSSGSWNEREKLFDLVPEMRLNYIYNFSYISNENESYFTYSLYNPNIISRFIMDVSGQVKQLSWLDTTQQWNLFWSQPRQQCEVHNLCGAFGSCTETVLPFCNCLTGFLPRSQTDWDLGDFSAGCVRNTRLQCGRTAERYGFLRVSSSTKQSPPNSTALGVGSAGECETSCLNNCLCNAYSFDDNGCSIWVGELLNLANDNSNEITVNVKVASRDLPSKKKDNRVIIGAVVGSVVTVVLLAGLVFGLIRTRRRFAGKTEVEGSLVSFVYRDLQTATKAFSEKLGGGGFGSVFKGVLPDSSVVAVKKLESVSQGEKQFRTEVSTIGTIQHVNLVRLRGFCSEGKNKLLVYDYMPNGSLDAHLFSNNKLLDWKTRYQIALGTARGLVYLHEKCRDCIIHCDIKPENILLDVDLCPKVADFGLAKLVGRDFSRVLTTMRGTRGYLAPEWLSGVAITAKADVYSYGMMIFELVSGARNSEQSEDGKRKYFPMLIANALINGEDLLIRLDPRLQGEASLEELSRLCKVACWCIQDDEENRPMMSQVEQILDGVLDVNMPPKPRSLQLFVDSNDDVVFFTESSTSQSSQSHSNHSSQAKCHTPPKAETRGATAHGSAHKDQANIHSHS